MKHYEQLMYQWLLNKNIGKTVDKYLNVFNVKKVAIYGAGLIGDIIFQDLKDGDIQVVCFIDKGKTHQKLYDIPIVDFDCYELFENLDAIIVSLGHCYYAIRKELRESGFNRNIINIEEIVYNK